MKKVINGLWLFVFCVSLMSFETVRAEAKWFGLTHVTLNSTKGAGFVVQPKRVRFGYSWKEGSYFSKLQAELQQADGKKLDINNSSDIVLDAYVGYRFSKTLSVKAGAFSMPVGMDFLTSIKSIDIAERGFDAKLVLNRAVGVMVSNSHNIWGTKFSYDAAYAGPAKRSAVVTSGKKGDHSAAIRVAVDKGNFHMEYSQGYSEDATIVGDGDDLGNFVVGNLGFSYKMSNWLFTLESTVGGNGLDSLSGISSVNGVDTSAFLSVAYMFNDRWTGILKHYQNKHDIVASGEQDITQELINTYLGINYKATKNVSVRANYIVATGKNKKDWSGFGGHKENTAVVLLQYTF